jgi:hypothetical protein
MDSEFENSKQSMAHSLATAGNQSKLTDMLTDSSARLWLFLHPEKRKLLSQKDLS